jgi:16S rRNA (guanine(966)-N(2))-methyltransferase RsmD
MRIGSGSFKGRKLAAPTGKETRPLLALIRKSLFDILSPRMDGARVLDLYAGSGSFGFEALSRGAGTVTAVEKHLLALRALKENAEKMEAGGKFILLSRDAEDAVREMAGRGEKYDIIFLDPPFAVPPAPATLEGASGLLDAGGILVLRYPSARSLPKSMGALALRRDKRYGISKVGFYSKEEKG